MKVAYFLRKLLDSRIQYLAMKNAVNATIETLQAGRRVRVDRACCASAISFGESLKAKERKSNGAAGGILSALRGRLHADLGGT